MIVKELVALLGFQTDDATANKAQGSLENIIGLAKQAAVAFAAIKVFGVFKDMAVQVAELGDKFDEMSQRTGASAQSLQAWGWVADSTGASIGDVEVGIKTLSRVASEAASGGKGAQEAFAKLGVSVRNADGSLKTAEQLLPSISDGLAGLTNDTERTAMAQKVLGRSGTRLLPMLKSGSKALDDQMQVAKDLGLVMDEDLIASAARWDDSENRLKAGVQGLKNIVGKALIPALTNVTDTMVNWIKANRKWIAEKIGPIIQGVGESFARVARFISDAIGRVRAWADSLDPMQKKFAAIGAVAAAVAAILLLPGGSILLLIGLIALLVDDFQAWREGGKSVIGDLIQSFQEFIDTVPGLGDSLSMAWDSFKAFFGYLQDMLFTHIKFWIDLFTEGPAAAFGNLKSNVLMTLESLWSAIGGPIQTALAYYWQLVTDFFTGIWNWIVGTVNGIVQSIVDAFTGAWNAILSGVNAAVAAVASALETIYYRAKGVIDDMVALLQAFASNALAIVMAPFEKAKGLISGILGMVGVGGGASAAAQGMANVSAGPGGISPGMATASPARGNTVISPQTSVGVNVTAAPGMSEEALAQAVAKHVEEAIENQNRLAIQSLSPSAVGA